MFKNFRIMLLILPALLFSELLFAAAGGKVVFKVGDPVVKNQSGVKDIKHGDVVGSGDLITTRSGLVHIEFPDKSFLSLKPKTEFKIESYQYDDKKDSGNESKYRLSYGEVRTVSGLIGKKNKKNYAIETPVATIGIRGTKFRVIVFQLSPGTGDPSNFQLTLKMGESGAVDIFMPSGEVLELSPKQIESIGGIDNLVEFIQTAAVTESISQLEELPVLVEKVTSSGGSQIVSDAETEYMSMMQEGQEEEEFEPQL
jgi:hypothetical protein